MNGLVAPSPLKCGPACYSKAAEASGMWPGQASSWFSETTPGANHDFERSERKKMVYNATSDAGGS